jgi:hypothetical protein
MMKKTETQKGVERLLAENVPSRMTGVTPRDSDKELLIQYMQRILGMNLNAAQIELIRTVNFESIRRSRQRLQENGKYWGSPEVMQRRRIKSYEIQQVAPKESPAGLQRRIQENV